MREIAMIDRQIAHDQQAMAIRRAIYEKGYSAMGQYTAKFYSHGAHMGRTFNAMMIAGFGEMAAAYIDSKTEQFKIDAIDYAIKAIVAAAEQKWTYAAAYGLAAAKYGAIGGVAALAAGYIRSSTQAKADAIAGAQEDQWDAATAGGSGGDTGLQRRQASGIVNTRPISVNVYSTVNINSGYNIFGDADSAVDDLYSTRIRNKIEDDIASGMLAVA
jgi:hypothetical protein